MDNFKPILSNFTEHGALYGLRILDCGSFIAVPWAGTLAAEAGAEVIKIENPHGDTLRGIGKKSIKGPKGHEAKTYWIQDARCKLDFVLDYKSDEAKEIMSRLIKESDIWMESSIPGTFPKKFGMTDEWILEQNPKIVIAHVSGYGQTGDPAYVKRASYDMIGQAFGGFCEYTGYPDGEPMRTTLAINDYITALWTLWSILAAYISAQRTGKGQVVDIAQYEAQARMLEARPADYLNYGELNSRQGNSMLMQPYGIFECSDGYLAVAATGPSYQRIRTVIPALQDEKYASMMAQFTEYKEIGRLTAEWLKTKTREEADKILTSVSVPCSPIMTLPDMVVNSQYQARDMFIEWEDEAAGTVKGVGLVPKFNGTPSTIWRGAPELGQDTEAILKWVGYDDEEIAALEEKGSVVSLKED